MIPTEKETRNAQHHHIGGQDIVPGVHIFVLRQCNGDKIRTTRADPGPQT